LEIASRLLPNMRIPRMDVELFVGPFDDIPVLELDDDQLAEEPPAKKQNKDCLYQDELLDMYRVVDLEYPPDLATYPDAFRKCIAPLTERERGLLCYAEAMEPYPSSMRVPQFIHYNQSILFLYGKHGDEGKTVFHEVIPTIAASSCFLMRMKLPADRTVRKLLRGNELMRIIGWGTPTHPLSYKLAKSCAGNAFSGFADGPMLACVMPALGHVA
jgi:hypothetical protein